MPVLATGFPRVSHHWLGRQGYLWLGDVKAMALMQIGEDLEKVVREGLPSLTTRLVLKE